MGRLDYRLAERPRQRSSEGGARSRFERDRTSLRCPPSDAFISVKVLEMTWRRDYLMTPYFLNGR